MVKFHLQSLFFVAVTCVWLTDVWNDPVFVGMQQCRGSECVLEYLGNILTASQEDAPEL